MWLGFLLGAATVLLVGFVVVRLLGSGFLLYLYARVPWFHRLREKVPEGFTPVAVSCSGKGTITVDGVAGEQEACTIERVLSVRNRKIRVGCHGRYTIAQAQFILGRFGGDPVCGGIMRKVFAPRITEAIARFKMRRLLKRRQPLKGFVQRYEGEGHVSRSLIYVGARTTIARLLRVKTEQLVPAMLQPATT